MLVTMEWKTNLTVRRRNVLNNVSVQREVSSYSCSSAYHPKADACYDRDGGAHHFFSEVSSFLGALDS